MSAAARPAPAADLSADARTYGAKLHDRQHGWNCDCAPIYREKFDEYAGQVIEALERDGRLMPAPTEVRTEYRAWLHGGDTRGIRLETESSPRRADVVEWAEEQIGRYGITGYRVMRREHHIFADGARYDTAITNWVEDTEEQR